MLFSAATAEAIPEGQPQNQQESAGSSSNVGSGLVVGGDLTGPFHKQFFQVDEGVHDYHLCIVFGEELTESNRKDELLSTLKSKVREIKNDARDWGTVKVASMMVEHARSLGLSQVTSFDGLKEYWRKNPTPKGAAIVWHCLYGEFDFKPRWEQELEAEYMKLRNYQYKQSKSAGQKGCIAALFARCKRNKVRALLSIHKHVQLKFKREYVEGYVPTKKEKFQKRNKGCCIGPYAVIDGMPHFHPQLVIAEVKGSMEEARAAVRNLQSLRSAGDQVQLMKQPILSPQKITGKSTQNGSLKRKACEGQVSDQGQPDQACT